MIKMIIVCADDNKYKLQSIKDEVFKYEMYRNYWSNGAGSCKN